MKRICSLILLAGVCVALQTPARAEGTPACTLTRVRYNVQTGTSRITISFNGAVRYAATRHGDRITIGLSGAASALAPGNDLFKFDEGLVSTVKVDRPRGDSVAILVDVRDKAVCALALAATGDRLVFSAKPGANSGAVALAAQQHPAQAVTHAGSDSAAGTARTAAPAVPETRMNAGPQAGVPALTETSTVTLWAMLVLFSALSTGTLLFGLARRSWKRTRRIAAQPAPLTQETAPVLEPARNSEKEEPWDPVMAEEPEESEEPVALLARGLHRGTGELQLAFKMQGGGRVPALQHAVQDIGGSAPSGAGRIKIAKKLGLGRGEVDLAIRLKEFEETHVAMEEEA